MYEAKRSGRAGYHVYAARRDEARTLLTTTTDLHRAIERDEFRLHYQPIVDLATGEFGRRRGPDPLERPRARPRSAGRVPPDGGARRA